MSSAETSTSAHSPPQNGNFDAAWLGVIPAIGWILAYANELGHFIRHDVPPVFIELSLTQVIKAMLALLVPVIIFANLAESFKQTRPRKSLVAVVAVCAVGVVAIAVFAKPPGERAQALASASFGVGMVVVALFFAWAGDFVAFVGSESVQLFHRPTIVRFLLVMVVAGTLFLIGFGFGYNGGILKSAPIVQDVRCGPLPVLVARSGDTLLLKLPPERDVPTRIRLLSNSDAKSLLFRVSSDEEIRFRNTTFVGPCYREKDG